jgi:hypothetical protein
MRVSYITNHSYIPSKVQYGNVSGTYDAHYTYFGYTSGKIHNDKIGSLGPDTVYYYYCGGGWRSGGEKKISNNLSSLGTRQPVLISNHHAIS